MKFEYTDGCNRDFVELCHELDDFLNKAAGGEENRAEYIPYNKLADIHDVVVAYVESGDGAAIPAGCASFKKYDEKCAELKRVFVREEFRGRGISKKLLNTIEDSAKKKGFEYLILETGEVLTNAMALYRKTGFEVFPNYGPYKCMADSVCMKKKL